MSSQQSFTNQHWQQQSCTSSIRVKPQHQRLVQRKQRLPKRHQHMQQRRLEGLTPLLHQVEQPNKSHAVWSLPSPSPSPASHHLHPPQPTTRAHPHLPSNLSTKAWCSDLPSGRINTCSGGGGGVTPSLHQPVHHPHLPAAHITRCPVPYPLTPLQTHLTPPCPKLNTTPAIYTSPQDPKTSPALKPQHQSLMQRKQRLVKWHQHMQRRRRGLTRSLNTTWYHPHNRKA
mgnify:CR=1 FL=1